MGDGKPTPGPWWISGDCILAAPRASADDPEPLCVAEFDFDCDTRIDYDTTGAANARLITASPDLLSIARRWDALDAGAWDAARHAREKAELLADTRAAIRKAEVQA